MSPARTPHLVRTIPAATLALGAALLLGPPAIAAGSSATARATLVAKPAVEKGPELGRLGGANRYATAVAVSSRTWDDGAAEGKEVLVASGEDFPDALAGGPAAASIGVPLLLVPRTGALPAVVADELTRLKPASITIVGGAGVVAPDMADTLAAFASTKQVHRKAGADRYETAAQLADYAVHGSGATASDPDIVYVANGATFADALSGGAAAALDGAPLLLTPQGSLNRWTAQVLERFTPAKVVVLGGPGAVSAATFDQIAAHTPNAVRVGGSDRYETSALLSKAVFPAAKDVTQVFLSSGLTFPDALAASPAVGVLGDISLLLTRPDCLPAASVAEVARLSPELITAIGGTAAVSDAALGGRSC